MFIFAAAAVVHVIASCVLAHFARDMQQVEAVAFIEKFEMANTITGSPINMWYAVLDCASVLRLCGLHPTLVCMR